MKKIIFSFLVFCFLSAAGFAQFEGRYDPVGEKIMKARKAFFTQELSLSQEDINNFWPLYTEFQIEREKINKKYNSKTRIQFMSDEEVDQFITGSFQREEELLGLKRGYFQRFKKVLPIRKVAAINQTENKFKRSLLEEMRNRRANPRGTGKRPRN